MWNVGEYITLFIPKKQVIQPILLGSKYLKHRYSLQPKALINHKRIIINMPLNILNIHSSSDNASFDMMYDSWLIMVNVAKKFLIIGFPNEVHHFSQSNFE